jgi:hypothetical protein
MHGATLKIMDAKQARLHNSFKNTKCKLLRTKTQRTQISRKDSNGTKHGRGPPEDGHEERPKHARVLYLQTRF